jgi:hypothetical protein
LRTLTLVRVALSAAVGTVSLAACGGSQPLMGSPGAMPQSGVNATHAERGGSWMLPEASKAKALLYVSDESTNAVFVYDYKSGTLVGKLRGVRQPYGECVDARGAVWVTELAAEMVVRYPHGGISATKHLSTDGSTVGCSVDPTTGNLAVSNVSTASGGGDIRVFTSSGYTDYWSDYCYYLEQPGYDNAGNLYVEAYSASYVVYVCELPHGGSSLAPVSVSQHIYGPGSVMWDGKYVTLTDEFYDDSHSTAIYQVAASKSGGLTIVGTTVLTDTCDGNNAEIWQPFIVGSQNTPVNEKQGTALVGFDTDCAYRHRFSLWSYPSGGPPIGALASEPKSPSGNAVSFAR